METPHTHLDSIPTPQITIESGFAPFVPDEFKADPFAYFNEQGKNIKSGTKTYHESGEINEDPEAVKDLPVWKDSEGQELAVVAKKINTEKAQVKKKSDPFYESKIMELAQELELPSSRPVATIEQSGMYMIVMEKVPGFRWVNRDIVALKSQGFSHDDLAALESEANEMMTALAQRYDEAGIVRTWKLRDMIFDIDVTAKKLRSLTPVDWERTKLDPEKIAQARARL